MLQSGKGGSHNPITGNGLNELWTRTEKPHE